jgi:hypothetical protein
VASGIVGGHVLLRAMRLLGHVATGHALGLRSPRAVIVDRETDSAEAIYYGPD